MPKERNAIGETDLQRDIRCGYVKVKFDEENAMRDPLIWICLLLYKASFGVIDTGRWRRYLTIETRGSEQ